MSSSPSDTTAALPAAPRELIAAPDAEAFEIRQRGWVKRLLPQTMFGRSLLLIVMPLILAQIIAISVFYGRHWEIVSRRLSTDAASGARLTRALQ